MKNTMRRMDDTYLGHMHPHVIIASFLVLLVGACTSSSRSVSENDRTLVNGHRGLRGLYPENSLYGFEKTIAHGYYKLEGDLILTQDSQLVMFHDPAVSSALCEVDSEWVIYEHTYPELQYIVCGTQESTRFPKQEKRAHLIPLFKDFLAMCESHLLQDSLSYVIEIKPPGEYPSASKPSAAILVEAFIREVEEAGAEQKTILQSFDPQILEEYHNRVPDRPVLYLSEELDSVDEVLSRLSFRPDVLGVYHVALDKQKVDRLHELGIAVTAWTVNEPEDMARMKAISVDDIMSDYYWPH